MPTTLFGEEVNLASFNGLVLKCSHCRAETDLADCYTNDSEALCADCFDSTDICSECNERAETSEIEGREFCEVCGEDLPFCERCESTCLEVEEVSVLDGHRTIRQYWCEPCRDSYAHACEDCHTLLCDSTLPGRCESCQEDYYVCDNCGEEVHQDNAVTGESDSVYCSTFCRRALRDEPEGEREEDESLHAYDYKPRAKFHGAGPEYFGIELELEGPSSSAPSESWLYCKLDGSVRAGYEIVTHPLSRAWINEHRRELENMLGELKEAGCKSYNAKASCGMHVHVSKDSVTPMQLYKIQKLFYENPAFILMISRRKEEFLRQWANCYDKPTRMAKMAKYKDALDVTRYSAINLRPNKTVEFRIFRGTLVHSGFFANLEFIFSVLDYCAVESIAGVSRRGYLNFVKANNSSYPDLANFLREKGLV